MSAEEIEFDIFVSKIFKYGTIAMGFTVLLGIVSLVIYNISINT